MHPWVRQLKKRNVVQWSLAYLAAAWLVLQVAHLVGQQFEWPDAVLRGTTLLLATGFLAAVVISWFHGEKGTQQVTAIELVMLAGILVVAGAAVAFVAKDWREVSPGGSVETAAVGWLPMEEGAVAVLPFTDLSGDPGTEYFSQGVTEDILTTLSRTTDLKVISRTSVMQYRESPKPVRQIGRELGVAHVLEGGVRRQGDRVRISAQLVDARTGHHLWADVYDRDLEDVFLIQADVARQIARALHAVLTGGDAAGGRPTANLAAYDLFLRARELGGSTREDNNAAMALLGEALRLDPDFVAAMAALSMRISGGLVFHALPHEWADSGVALANRAVAADAALADGWLALSWILWFQGRGDEAAEAALRALELDPNDVDAMDALFWAENHRGNHAESVRWARRAYRLNPRVPGLPNAIGVALLGLGDYEGAERWLARSLDLDPDYIWGHFNQVRLDLYRGRGEEARRRAEALLSRDNTGIAGLIAAGDVASFSGDWPRARELYQRAYDIAPETVQYEPLRLALAVTLLRTGESERARGLLEEALASLERDMAAGREGSATHRALGVIRALRGEKDTALAHLTQAAELGWVDAEQARRSPLFHDLRSEPAFQELVDRLAGLQARTRRELEPGGTGAIGAGPE